MPKFYVESGPHLQLVIQAENEAQALILALATLEDREPLFLADVLIINERGFVWERPDHELYGEEIVLSTRDLLGMPENEAQVRERRKAARKAARRCSRPGRAPKETPANDATSNDASDNTPQQGQL